MLTITLIFFCPHSFLDTFTLNIWKPASFHWMRFFQVWQKWHFLDVTFFILVYKMRITRIKIIWNLLSTVSTYTCSCFLSMNIHAYRNKQETRRISSWKNRRSAFCHLFTPGWMWVEMLEVKSGGCQRLCSIQKLNSSTLLSSAEIRPTTTTLALDHF